MTFEESYQKYLILSESNGTTDYLSTDKGRYTVIFNLYQNKIIEWLIESNSSDENRYLQKIKINYKKLSLKEKSDIYDSFYLPEDYFDFLNLIPYASKGKCVNQILKSEEVKQENVPNIFLDVNSNPSFKYRETIYTIGENAVQVYKQDFDIDSVNMSYYRYPKQIELVYPDNPESNFKDDILEFDDKLSNRIILAAVSLHQLSSKDPNYQAFKQETIQKF